MLLHTLATRLAIRAASYPSQFSRSVLFVPQIVENTSRGERTYDIFSRLLKERIICLFGEIDDTVAGLAIAQLLFLENDSSGKPISMYINSPGGVVTSGLGIYDTMQFIQSPVHTTCIGQASSMGSLLLAAGESGHRFSLPNSRIMVHQPSGGAVGMASDIDIKAREILRLRQRLNEIYAYHTGQAVDDIQKCLDRDTFFSPEEAINFGLIDKVVQKPIPAKKIQSIL